MPKRKPAAKKKPNRKRGRARQIYLSITEDRIFEKMLKRQKVTASQLVRDWLERAEAQYQRRHKSAGKPVDKRQLTIEGA